MANELVSIIMPAYNSVETISPSIVSATTQSYKNIELILVDDGSTDNTAEMCKNHARNDERIRCVSQKNRGVAAARNTGIEMARGDFIAFLDADDLWEKEKIELQVAVSRNQPEAIILTQLQRFSGDGSSLRLLSKTLPPKYTRREQYVRTILNLGNHEMASFATALVRKVFLDAVGLFDEMLITAEDWDLWLRLAFHYPFVNIDQPLHFYRKRPDSLTLRTQMKKTLNGQLYVMDKVAKYGVLLPSEIRAAKMRKYLEFARIYRYQKMRFAAFQSAAKAVVSCPAGCGELFWKRFFRKSSNILKEMKYS